MEHINFWPKVDVFHFNLLTELVQRELEPDDFDNAPTRGTSAQNFAVHNYEDRSATQIIPHDDLFLGHFQYDARNRRPETHISEAEVLGNFEERIHNLTAVRLCILSSKLPSTSASLI